MKFPTDFFSIPYRFIRNRDVRGARALPSTPTIPSAFELNNSDGFQRLALSNLDLNVISDYRGRRHQTFYDPSDRTRHIDGMKIMPIDTKMLRRMLERRLGYSIIYKMFEEHFNRDGDPASWHDELRSAIDQA